MSDDRARITARFDARSIEVVDAIIDGRRSPGTLGPRDKDKIRSNITSDVIPVTKHPDVRFESSEVSEDAGGWTVRGRLELAGRSRELVVNATREEGAALAEAVLHQPDFGIKPYSAMLGTLQLSCGALAGFAVSAWQADSALPLTATLAACACLSWTAGRVARSHTA